jgi:hypothetical protein
VLDRAIALEDVALEGSAAALADLAEEGPGVAACGPLPAQPAATEDSASSISTRAAGDLVTPVNVAELMRGLVVLAGSRPKRHKEPERCGQPGQQAEQHIAVQGKPT